MRRIIFSCVLSTAGLLLSGGNVLLHSTHILFMCVSGGRARVCLCSSLRVHAHHVCETWLRSAFRSFLPDGFLEKASLVCFKRNEQNASALPVFPSH